MVTYANHLTKNCAMCGKEFTTHTGSKKYCGSRFAKNSCSVKANRENTRERYRLKRGTKEENYLVK